MVGSIYQDGVCWRPFGLCFYKADAHSTLPVHVLRYTENYLLDKSSPIYGVLLALQYYYCGELLAV